MAIWLKKCGKVTQKVWQYGVAIWLVGKVTINHWVSFNAIMSTFWKMVSFLISAVLVLRFPIFMCSNFRPPGIVWNILDGNLWQGVFPWVFSSLLLHVLTHGFDFTCSWLCVICQLFWLYWRLHMPDQFWTCLLQVSYL